MNKISDINKANEAMNINPDNTLTQLVEELDPRTKECLMDILQPADKNSISIAEKKEVNSPRDEIGTVLKFERFIQENRNIT